MIPDVNPLVMGPSESLGGTDVERHPGANDGLPLHRAWDFARRRFTFKQA